jgi:hypothetical protein
MDMLPQRNFFGDVVTILYVETMERQRDDLRRKVRQPSGRRQVKNKLVHPPILFAHGCAGTA